MNLMLERAFQHDRSRFIEKRSSGTEARMGVDHRSPHGGEVR
jgi:hypothetical protein